MTDPQQMEIPMEPRVRVRLTIDAHEDLPRTDWNIRDDPPTSGYWEVTDELTGTKLARWWWAAEVQLWFAVGPPSTPAWNGLVMPAPIFHGTHLWRGLRQPSPFIYPTPPYQTKELVDRAQRANVTLRTQYVTVTPIVRDRVRL